MYGGLWHYTGGRYQDHPQEIEMQKGKMAVWEGFTNRAIEEKLKAKEKKKDIPIWMHSSDE